MAQHRTKRCEQAAQQASSRARMRAEEVRAERVLWRAVGHITSTSHRFRPAVVAHPRKRTWLQRCGVVCMAWGVPGDSTETVCDKRRIVAGATATPCPSPFARGHNEPVPGAGIQGGSDGVEGRAALCRRKGAFGYHVGYTGACAGSSAPLTTSTLIVAFDHCSRAKKRPPNSRAPPSNWLLLAKSCSNSASR